MLPGRRRFTTRLYHPSMNIGLKDLNSGDTSISKKYIYIPNPLVSVEQLNNSKSSSTASYMTTLWNFENAISSDKTTYELPCSSAPTHIIVRLVKEDLHYNSNFKAKRIDAEVHYIERCQDTTAPAMGKTADVEMFEIFVEQLKAVVETLPNFEWGLQGTFAVLFVCCWAVKKTTRAMTWNRFCEGFEITLNDFEKYTGMLYEFVKSEYARTPGDQLVNCSEIKSCYSHFIVELRKWNTKEKFYAGKSDKFIGIKSFTDFLSKTDAPEECAVCKITVLNETSDFGILSACPHVFCSQCLTEWFSKKNTCPMCRQKSFWMSRTTYETHQVNIARALEEKKETQCNPKEN